MVLETILSIFTEIIKDPIKNIFSSAKRHVCYAFTCDINVEKLHKETEELNNKISRLQISVREATRQGEQIHEDVNKWLNSAEEAIQEAQQLIGSKDEEMKKRCFIGFGPDLKTRYQLSRKAEKKASAIRDGKEPDENSISYRDTPKQMTTPSVYSREALQSRVSLLKDVMNALKDPEINKIGVYGLGGVGKTTLAKEVHRQAQDDKFFDDVVFVAVSQSPEVIRIQKEIAEVIGLKFKEEGLLVRANELCKRLKNGSKTLIILDDVWNFLPLKDVGIPFGDDCKECKILLTSRKRDVCCTASSNKMFDIGVLSDEEAWSLFKMTVADGKDTELPPIATEVAKKCSGLPLLISIVATDLRNKGPSYWKDKLRKLSVLDSEEIDEKVHKVLESSYKNLRDNEHRSFFLLCGLFGQSNVRIQYLLEYSMGLDLFKHITDVKDARDKVDILIRELKDECLLIDGDMDGFVKMHDVVRDTAIKIASRVQHAFVGTSGFDVWEWPKENCTRICLPYCDIKEGFGRLRCPKAEMLLLFTEDFSLQIPDAIFEGMSELKVVDLTGMHFASLPSSLDRLKNIQTLCLHNCQLDDGIAIIGKLEQLQVLSFADSFVVELPREIGQLSRLKLLDLSNCRHLEVIPANVLSKLRNLEELYMVNNFVGWEVEGMNNNRRNASLGELEELSSLRTLELQVVETEVTVIPEALFSKGLEKYRIFIGVARCPRLEKYKTSKTLMLEVQKRSIIRLGHGMRFMLRDAEYVDLNGIGSGLYDVDGEEFPHLKHLVIEQDDVIQHIMKCAPCAFPNLESLCLSRLKSLKNIWVGEVAAAGTFTKLTTLKVSGCDSLTNLLSIHTARCLSQLQVLEVGSCTKMEYIVVGESEDNDEMVEFTQLVSLKLDNLDNLKSFCKGKKQLAADPAVPKDASLSLFNKKVSLPKLKDLRLSGVGCRKIWEDHQHQLSSTSSSNLTTLNVYNCFNLKHLFSIPLVTSLSHLKSISVNYCRSMEEIILTEEESVKKEEEERKLIVFPELDFLELNNLEKLRRFCSGYSIKFQSLRELRIKSCSELISFVVASGGGGGGADIDLQVDTETSSPTQIHSLFNDMVYIFFFPSLI